MNPSEVADYIRRLEGQIQQQAQALQTLQGLAAQLQAPTTAAVVSVPKDAVRKPDVFKGALGRDRDRPDRLEDWLSSVQDYLELKAVPTDSRAIVAASFLDGDARLWWRTRTMGERESFKTDYSKFEGALRLAFEPVNARKIARDRLAALKQKGPAVAYVRDFRSLCFQINDMSPEDALDRFVRGLRPKIAMEVSLRQPRSLEDAMAMAERIDSIMWSAGFGRTEDRPSRPNHSEGPTPMELGSMESKPKQSKEERDQLRQQGRCFLCKESGHIARECPKNKKKEHPKGKGQ